MIVIVEHTVPRCALAELATQPHVLPLLLVKDERHVWRAHWVGFRWTKDGLFNRLIHWIKKLSSGWHSQRHGQGQGEGLGLGSGSTFRIRVRVQDECSGMVEGSVPFLLSFYCTDHDRGEEQIDTQQQLDRGG